MPKTEEDLAILHWTPLLLLDMAEPLYAAGSNESERGKCRASYVEADKPLLPVTTEVWSGGNLVTLAIGFCQCPTVVILSCA
ncbi:MAG TPA: hypothetical protein GXX30_10765 [Firmicutes bacterium]|nr:hypothetical protein [Candidatus Fermentithermobacillaceae bacterium]